MVNVSHFDGAQNKAAVFKSPNATTTLICLPAMGVKAVFYKRFAESLCLSGFNVITIDWRGIGSSNVRASRNTDFGYQQLIDDIKDIIDLADNQFSHTQKVIVGHSLGGQIGSLFAARFPDTLTALILITTCSVHYKGWEGLSALKVLGAGCVFYPISIIWGYFPGSNIGFGGREAKTVMKDWCYNALTGKYKLSSSVFDYDKALANLTLPVLALSVEGDKLASKSSVINFLNKLNSKAPVTHRHLLVTDVNVSPLNHFSWAKKPDEFVKIIKQWLNDLNIINPFVSS